MKASLLFIVAWLSGCSDKPVKNLEFDIVALKVNAFPYRDLAVEIFREDTAFVSTFEDVAHLQRDANVYSQKSPPILKPDDSDSVLAMKEVKVTTKTMSKLNDMINALDFKGFAINRGRDGVLDGTLWTLEVKSSTGYISSISFRRPAANPDNQYESQIKDISEYIFMIHGIKLTNVPE